jgi:hypothetical protein
MVYANTNVPLDGSDSSGSGAGFTETVILAVVSVKLLTLPNLHQVRPPRNGIRFGPFGAALTFHIPRKYGRDILNASHP